MEPITDAELTEWETDLANGYTVDQQLGMAFLRVVERLRDTQEQLAETERIVAGLAPMAASGLLAVAR